MSNERPSTLTWIYAAGAVALVLITIFAATFAVQEHNDRVLSDEITRRASELQDTGARITSIRDADMKDMNDYIRAYSEIAPPLDALIDIYRESRTSTTRPTKETRRLLRVERLYRRPQLTNWENMSEILNHHA